MKKSIFFSCYSGKYSKDKKEGKELLPFIEQSIVYAKEDGLDGIELLPGGDLNTDKAREYAKVLRERLDKENIPCACFSYGVSMLADPKGSLETLKKFVDVAATLGSPYFHHTLQCNPEYEKIPKELSVYQNAEKIFVDVSKEVAYYAGEKGICCIYEDQGYFVNTVERMGNLIHKIGLPNTGVCLDCGNSLFCDVPAEAFAGAFASIVKHIHVKDYIKRDSFLGKEEGWSRSYSGSWLRRCLPGTGIVDLEKIFSIMLSVGYDAYFSLENQNVVFNLSNEYDYAEIDQSFKNIQYFYNRAAASLQK